MSKVNHKAWRQYQLCDMDYRSTSNASTIYDLILVIVQTGFGASRLGDLMLELWEYADEENYDRVYRLIEDIYNDVTITVSR